MTLSLIGFLWRLRRKPDTAWLITCLILIELWLLGLFFDQTLFQTPWYWCWVISNAIYLVYIPLIQFAYHFPCPTPHLRREARLTLFLSVLLSPLVVWNVLSYLIFVATGRNLTGSDMLVTTILLAGTFWAIVVLLRRTVYFSTGQTGSGWFQGFVMPQGRKAQATRAFMLAGLIPLIGVVVAFLFPGSISGYPNTVTGLLMIFATGIVYFNAVPEESTFMVKLVSITLVTLLAVLGLMGYVVEPFYQAAYPVEPITDRLTFHVQPNGQGGYDLAAAPFQFRDNNLGRNLELSDDGSTVVELPFAFSFYGQAWTEVHLSANGYVVFGSSPQSSKFWAGLQPTIAPLWLDFDPSAGGGVFVNQASESVVVTWDQVPRFAREEVYTIQLTLHRDGSFDFNYRDIPANSSANLNALIGFLPGRPSLEVERVHFSRNLVTSTNGGLIVGGQFLGRLEYVHERLLPLAVLIVGASLLVLIVFPVFFRVNLTKPLESLLEAVKRVNAGDLNVTAPVRVEDEIGFLTRSFNEMVHSLQTSATNLRESETRFRTLFEYAPLCIFEVDCARPTPTIVRANQQAQKIYGWSADEFSDIDLGRIIPSQVERDRREIVAALQSGNIIVLESISQRRNGALFPARISAATGDVAGPDEGILIVEDITVEKERHSEEEAIAEERRRIAREIHDGLAQNLASLRMRASLWQALLAQDPAKMHAELEQMQTMLSASIQDVRRSIFALRPIDLEELGFYPALQRFTSDFGEQNQLRVDLCVLGSPDNLPASLELVLFRIIQEAMHNVSKHARANTVWINLNLAAGNSVTLQIRDDGLGFDLSGLNQFVRHGHLGLPQMRERVENLQGTFLLHSQPGQGTELKISLPLSKV
ncbi:MAG: HAMP domain-containing protein [Anaerolineae bacterium]|nr:HAMP domain-containing protein [Anaerolineae bacterium]